MHDVPQHDGIGPVREVDSAFLLENVPFRLELDVLLDHVHCEADSPLAAEAGALLNAATVVARPKGAYKLAAIDGRGPDWVTIAGTTFNSRVLAVNLADLQRVFPFVATCGTELEEWSRELPDPMHQFWADAIKEAALREAIDATGNHLNASFGLGRRSTMNPGSLEDWPIDEQRPLFSLFEGVIELVGVSLNESFLMSPVKSVSGLWFETGRGFQNCLLCPRENCPNRRAPYDPGLYERRYAGGE